MSFGKFAKAGHAPTLFSSFLYFDLSFMVWVLLGPLGVGIAKDLGLSHAEKGLMVATPVLAGALLRIVMGILVDRLSPKKAAIIGQVVVIATMLYAWQIGVHSYAEVLVLGLFLGVAGASFAAALPLASRWYPAEHQGTAMGIAVAGNSGTALAALFAPGLAAAFGWVNVFGIVLIPLVAIVVTRKTVFEKPSMRLRSRRSITIRPEAMPSRLMTNRPAGVKWVMAGAPGSGVRAASRRHRRG